MTPHRIVQVHPTTPVQQGFLLGTLTGDPADALFVEQAVLPFRGELDPARLRRCCEDMIADHEILRTAFAWDMATDPHQVVLDHVDLAFDTVQGDSADIPELLLSHRLEPFDLTAPPLLRLALHHSGDQDWRLIWTHHHAVLDGWAHLLLAHELVQRYTDGLRPEPPVPFGQYAQWSTEQSTQRERAYWTRVLRGYDPPPSATSRLAPAGESRFGQHSLTMPSAPLSTFTRAHGTTLAAAVVACWGLVAGRRHDREDIAVGVTVSGRTRPFPGVEHVIGPMVNTVPVRLVPPPESWASDWISTVQDLLSHADRHSACSSADVHEWTDISADQPLYDSIVSLTNYPHTLDGARPRTELTLRLPDVQADGGRTRYALALVVETFDGLRLRLVNDRYRAGDEEAKTALSGLRDLLTALTAHAEPTVRDLRALLPDMDAPVVAPYAATRKAATQGSPDSLRGIVVSTFSGVLGQQAHADTDFLTAGGHSLLAVRLVARLRTMFDIDLTLGDLLQHRTPRALCARIRALLLSDTTALEALPPLIPRGAESDDPFPLTPIQQAYWAGRRSDFELGGVDSHLYTEVELPDLDIDRLSEVWRGLVERHAMLRAVLTPDGQQRVLRRVPQYRITTHDLRIAPDAPARLEGIRERLAHPQRDVETWPLFTIEAAVLPSGTTRLFLSFDLLIGDALSWRILYHEARRRYEDPNTALSPLYLTFADYVAHLRTVAASSRYRRDRDYWGARLADLPAPPGLPVVTTKSPSTPRFSRLQCALPSTDAAALRRVAGRHGTTLSVLLLAAFAETLGRFTNSRAFVINVTVYNRLEVHPQVNSIVGDFTSTALVGVELSRPLFADRLRALQRRVWSDMDHMLYGGVEVLRDLRERTGSPVTASVVFTSTLDLDVEDATDAPPFPGTVGHGIGQTPQVLFDYQTYEAAGNLVINFDTVDGLLPDGLVQAMFDEHIAVLHALADDPDAPRRPRLLTPALPPPVPEALGGARLLHEPFLTRVREQPQHTAVVCAGQRISYAELHAHAQRTADQIAAAHPEGDLVALVFHHEWQQVAAALGTLMAGYAFVPLDPSWPQQRISDLLETTEPALVLAQDAAAAHALPGHVERLLADDPAPPLPASARAREADDPAYVIFTSGSTGTPKGVTISHKGALNTVLDVNERFGVCPDDAVLAVSPFTFDLAIYDVFGLLAAGGTLVVPAREQRTDPTAWIELLRGEHITVWNSVPVLLELLLDTLPQGELALTRMRLCLLSGDWISVQLPERLRGVAPDCRIVGFGGATEGSIWSILYEVGQVDPSWTSIPYGTAMTGQQVDVLDDALQPCPVWTPGQIYISGHGTALGYWKAPELTEAAFVLDGRTGRRLYRTGDWGRLKPDGTMEFLGRRDSQVKIRGYRVDLSEVETTLAAVDGVQKAVVVAIGERANQRLAGFVVGSRGAHEIRMELARRLPAHMIPATLTCLPSLPVNPTGKTDRIALTRIAETSLWPEPSAEAEGEFLHQKLWLALRALVPGDPRPDDDLLTLGMTSVDLIRLANVVEKHCGTRPDLGRFYRNPTLRTLAAYHIPISRPSHEAVANSAWATTVITDPDERAAFCARRPVFPLAPRWRTLPDRPVRLTTARLRPPTARSFGDRAVSAAALSDLLDSLRRSTAGGRLGFAYPSAGGIYGVQVHLHVRPERVDGIRGGVYFYHPEAHDLIPQVLGIDLDTGLHLGSVNRPLIESAAFTVFLVADPADSAPLYGTDAEPLAMLDAGYVGHLLYQTAAEMGLALCPVHGIDFDAMRWLLAGGERLVLLHTLLGGPPPASEPGGAS
ncbi:amino acid adenylation domain-containing protein [Amycolatopsis sp. cmx-11-51]|uniref:amino acid adenylation domain-containing protein n=1 Tax=Amycolatopsis sp. cmx-11-51 TaxID=2785797 RepID=UPI0039E2ADCC